MVKKITLECSQCHEICELFLSSDVRIIIINCPSCWTPIMCFNNKIFILTEKQIEEIKAEKQESSILRILQKIVRDKNDIKALTDKYPQLITGASPKMPGKVPAVPAGKSRREIITRDDITNLQIELQKCIDVKDFVNGL